MLTIVGFILAAAGSIFIYLGQRQDSEGDKAEIIGENKKNVDSVKEEVKKRIDVFETKLDQVIIRIDIHDKNTIPMFAILQSAVHELKDQNIGTNNSILKLEREFEDFKLLTNNSSLEAKIRVDSLNSILDKMLFITTTLEGDLLRIGAIPDQTRTSVRQTHQAINITKQYIEEGKYIESNSRDLEISVDELKEDSRIEFVSSILNDPETIKLAERNKMTRDIQNIHESMTAQVTSTINKLVSEWRAIANDYSIKVNGATNENLVTLTQTTGYSPDFSPELLDYPRFGSNDPSGIRLRFNLGNINTSPLIEMTLYMNFNPNQWEQEYLILGAYIPKKAVSPFKPVRITESKIEKINYKTDNPKDKLTREIIETFKRLDKVLMSKD